MAYFSTLHEVVHPDHPKGGWQLWLQYGFLHFPGSANEPSQAGYRLMWRRSDSSLSSRPVRFDSLHDILTLMRLAIEQGWGNFDGGVHEVVRQPVTVTIGDLTAVIDGGDGTGEVRRRGFVTINRTTPDLNA